MVVTSKRASRGHTFIEIIFVLAIASILIFQAIPAFGDLIRRTKTRNYVYELISLINTSRQLAIERNSIITICGSSDEINCDRRWDRGIMIFTDGGNDGKVDGKDRVIRYQNVIDEGSLEWRAFQNKPYLQFRSDGFTNHHNGNLTYCPGDNDLGFARQLIINVAGRVRNTDDTDSNGIVNGADGKDISC